MAPSPLKLALCRRSAVFAHRRAPLSVDESRSNVRECRAIRDLDSCWKCSEMSARCLAPDDEAMYYALGDTVAGRLRKRWFGCLYLLFNLGRPIALHHMD